MGGDKTDDKQALYALLLEQLTALCEGERQKIPNLANASALIFQAVPELNWAGFYLSTGAELLLGPFQGRPACIRIPFAKGVCGAAVREGKTQRVKDVHAFPGHIACDGASRSEIVIPMELDGKIVAVMDVDSPALDRFTDTDQRGLEALAAALCQACDW